MIGLHKISFLNSVYEPNNPIAEDLDNFLIHVKTGTFRNEICRLRLLKQSNPVEYKKAKCQLPAALLNGSFSKATNDAFIGSNGIFNVDIDSLEGDIESHKEIICAELPSVLYCFISPSNQGLKIGIKIDADLIKSDADFKIYFSQIEHAFAVLGYSIDKNCKDVSRKCFISYDPDAYVNYNSSTFKLTKPFSAMQNQKGEVDAPSTILKYSADDYVAKAVNLLKKATSGNRHEYRIKAGRLAGGYIAGNLVDEEVILDALIKTSDEISDSAVTNQSELSTLKAAIELGKVTPINVVNDTIPVTVLSELDDSVESYSTLDVRNGTKTTHPLTELGNAMRLMDYCGQASKFIIGTNSFLHWTRDRYKVDIDGAIMRSNAAKLPEQIYKEALSYKENLSHFTSWSLTSQTRRTIENAVCLYKDFEAVRILPNCIDANKFGIGINGASEMIELETGFSRTTTPMDYITKTSNVTALGNSAEATRWLQFLDEVFGGDTELIDWVQRWCGYLLSGSTQEQIFVFCYGSGSNGKSVFIEMLKHIMGDYAKAIQPELLANNQRTAGAATPELAALKGVRLAIGTETEEGVQLAESLIKALTGGDTIVARPLYGAPIEYLPQFKIMLTGNHKPIIRGNDDGIWRRVRLLHFTQTFPVDTRDPYLKIKLQEESNHILAWLVEGCLNWQKKGLKDVPNSIKNATDDYRTDQDIVGKWLDDCCDLSPLNSATASALYLSYSTWCETNGLKKCSNIVLSRRFEERGLSKKRINTGMVYDGIAVRS